MAKKVAYQLSGIAFIFASWLVLYLAVQNSVVIPSPFLSVKEALLLLSEGYFYSALFSTLLRVLIGFIVSLILAVITAVLSYKFKGFAGVFSSVIAVLRSLPTLAVILIILVISRTVAPTIVCILTLFPLLHTAIFKAISSVSNELIEMCKVYKVPVKKQIFSLYIPSVFPGLYLDFSSALSFGLKLTVSAEILASVYGSVGGLMMEASLYGARARAMLFALTVIVCLIGIIIEFIGKFIFDRARGKVR